MICVAMNGGSSTRQEADDLVSIVVPVYNVEDYLPECLDSLLAQTYGNLEIILVDDGSTDGSSAICREYVERDERIRVYRKENGGLSSARNYGTSRATGAYLLYVDSDDAVAYNMVEQLLRALVGGLADIAVCGFKTFGDSSEFACSEVKSPLFKRMGASDALAYLYSERSSGCAAWAKLARIDEWRRVEFPEGRRFEDFPRIHCLFEDGLDVAITDEPLYFYRKRSGSITSSMSESVARELMMSLDELCRLEDGSRNLANARAFKVALECTRLISKIGSRDMNVCSDAWIVLKGYLIPALHARYASIFQKLRILMVYAFPDMGSRVSKRFMK